MINWRILTNIWHPASNHPFPQYWILRQYWTPKMNRPTAKPRRVLRGGLLMTWLQDVKDEPWFSGGVVSSAKWGLLIQVFKINPYSFVSCLSFTIDFRIQACPAGGFRYSLFKESRPQWLWKQKLMSWKHGSTIWRWPELAELAAIAGKTILSWGCCFPRLFGGDLFRNKRLTSIDINGNWEFSNDDRDVRATSSG